MNYQWHYDKLMGRAKVREFPQGYVEKHHIIPKCLGGSNEVENLVILTAPEHYVAHLLLVCIHPLNRGLVWAAIAMASGNSKNKLGRSGNKMYGWLREELSKRGFSESHRKRMSESAKIKVFTEEHRRKIGNASKGIKRQPFTDTHRKNLSVAQKGKERSKEYCENMSIIKKGFKMPPVTDQWRERQRAVRLGKKLPSEWSAKAASARVGLTRTNETKEKMRISRKLWWQKRKSLM